MTKPIGRFRGPSLTLLAAVHIVIFLTGLVAGALLHRGQGYVNPFASGEQVRLFLTQSPLATRLGGFFLFGSAVPFGIFAVTAVSRLRHLGVRAAGTNITLFGGLAAAFSLFLSGMATWILSDADVTASIAAVKALTLLSFLSGGAFYAVGFGLMAAGISITCYFTRLLPRGLVALGLVVAIAGELSWFSLVAYPANFFIPVTRFVGFVWMILTALALRKDRRLGVRTPTGVAQSQ